LNWPYADVGQCYPDNCPADNPRQTGATEVNTLGGWWGGDALYLLSYTFPHTASSLTLNFQGWNLQGPGDEFWGMDNLRVELLTSPPPEVIPEPATFTLLGGVLAMMAVVLRRRRATR